MAIKTTIGPKGVVSEKISGTTDKLIVQDRTFIKFVSSSADASTATVTPPLMYLRPGTSGLVTGSLPTIGSEEVGLRVLVVKDPTNGTMVLSGATGQKILEPGVALASAKLEYKCNVVGGVLDLVAVVSGSGTFYWNIVAGSSGSY